MTIYSSKDDLIGKLPEAWLDEACDDDGDGVAETTVFEAAGRLAAREIDGLLGQRYAVPFAPDAVPAIAKPASDIFILYNIYERRGVEQEENPYRKAVDFWRKKLSDIGAGVEPLSPDHKQKRSAVRVISERTKAASRHRFNS